MMTLAFVIWSRSTLKPKVLRFMLFIREWKAKLLRSNEAILRRSGWQSEGSNALRPPVIRSGDLELDPSARAASRAGEVLHLTSAEYDILRLFIGSPGQVLTREKLVE